MTEDYLRESDKKIREDSISVSMLLTENKKEQAKKKLQTAMQDAVDVVENLDKKGESYSPLRPSLRILRGLGKKTNLSKSQEYIKITKYLG